MSTPSAERLAYRPIEFARLTGLSLSTIKREIYNGNLRVLRVRRMVIIPIDVARQYLELQEKRESSEVLATTA